MFLILFIILGLGFFLITTYEIVKARCSLIKSNLQITGSDYGLLLAKKHGIKQMLLNETGDENFFASDQNNGNIMGLSYDNFHGSNLTAHTITAHEFGHAEQKMSGYRPYAIFSKWCQLFTKLEPTIFILTALTFMELVKGMVPYFILLILTVCSFSWNLLLCVMEYDASKRALNYLKQDDIGDLKKSKKILVMAGSTYLITLIFVLYRIFLIQYCGIHSGF